MATEDIAISSSWNVDRVRSGLLTPSRTDTRPLLPAFLKLKGRILLIRRFTVGKQVKLLEMIDQVCPPISTSSPIWDEQTHTGPDADSSEHWISLPGRTYPLRARSKARGYAGGDLQRYWVAPQLRRIAPGAPKMRKYRSGIGRNHRCLEGGLERPACLPQGFPYLPLTGPSRSEEDPLEICTHLETTDSR